MSLFDRDIHFTRLVQGQIDLVDLPTVALEIARDEYPALDMTDCLRRLDEMGAKVSRRLTGEESPERQIYEINRLLFEEEGYRGNAEEYYDPRNSFLNDVLERKLGIPITLSIVYLAVAQRAGMPLCGVGMPAHFVVKFERSGRHIIIDPFHGGAILSREACERRVSNVVGLPVTLDDDQLAASPGDQIVLRLLGNLKAIYIQQDDAPRALRVQQRIHAISPDDPIEVRDLGVLYLRNDRPGKAIELLESYSRLRPSADDVATVATLIKAARRMQVQMN